MRNKSRINCGKKAPFATEARARTCGKLRLAKTDLDMLWPYECRHCGKWHLTKKNQWGTRPITAQNSGVFG